MKIRGVISLLVAAQVLTLAFSLTAVAIAAPQSAPMMAPMGSAFTYQGSLTDNGVAANGIYDFQFRLYETATAINQIGITVLREDVPVVNGVFAIDLDFGTAVFTGEARFLDVGVQPGTGSGLFTQMTPRQLLNPVPYAIFATNAGTAGSAGILGTTTNLALDLNVNNARAFRLEPNATSPNVVGGHSANSTTTAAPGVLGATIGGGGTTGNANLVTDSYGVVGGGVNNQAGNGDATNDKFAATVGGGDGNRAGGSYSVVPGGRGNEANGDFSLASGRRSKVATSAAGSFAWADSQDADFAVSTADQFAIRARGGVRLAENAPNLRPNGVGEIYRDNVILAWGHALAGGGTTSRFNVLSVSQTSTGAYRVVLETPATSVNTMAITVTPRVTYAVPGTFVAANARNVVIDKIDAATFDVYIGTIATTSAAINTEFTFIVTGR